LPNVLPSKWHHAINVCLTILFGFTFSSIIEWCQYRYGLGRCEVDDVIMNTLGVVVGLSSYVISMQTVGDCNAD
jgi:glycopeptide antibiotics resistance protein